MKNLKTYLSDEQIEELYSTMYNLLKKREDEDRLLNMHMATFKDVYLKNKADIYLEDNETSDFYTYVEDFIYDDVCYE